MAVEISLTKLTRLVSKWTPVQKILKMYILISSSKRFVFQEKNFDENALSPIGKRENEFKVPKVLRQELRTCGVLFTTFARALHRYNGQNEFYVLLKVLILELLIVVWLNVIITYQYCYLGAFLNNYKLKFVLANWKVVFFFNFF